MKKSLYQKFIKRSLDLIFSLILIVVLSPIMFVISLFILMFMGRPIFFQQERPGLDEKIFTLYKFRTMLNKRSDKDADNSDEIRLKRFGKLIRSLSLDELPQLFNILKGEMSFIGPRPQLIKDMVFMSELHRQRHTIRPGLTGLAQVSGRNKLDWHKKLDLDIEYLNTLTCINDVKILIKTLFYVIKTQETVSDGFSTAEDYGDYLLRTHQINQSEYDQKLRDLKREVF